MRRTTVRPAVAHRAGTLVATATLLLLAACAGRQDPARAPVEFRGSVPGSNNAVTGTPGIVSYGSYEAAIARDGETVAEIAARVGISGAELGAYNGLQPGTVLRAGDELVLPPRPGGYGGVSVAAVSPGVAAAPAPAADPGAAAGGFPAGGVETGTLAPTAPGAAATATASGGRTGWTDASDGSAAWSPDLAAAAIDRADDGAPVVAPAPGSTDGGTATGGEELGGTVTAAAPAAGADITAPPSANAPLPPEPAPAARPASPGLSQYQSDTPELASDARSDAIEEEAEAADREAAAALAGAAPSGAPDLGISFTRPVDGAIAVPYNLSNSGVRNEGVDFDAPPGSVVRAAAAGEVALVSQSLGGLGTIVLIRHRGDVLTVYGRVTNVEVGKGSRVAAGQPIGVVAQGDGTGPPRMHFEIRRGAESVNPQDYL
ncbi:MAG: LysM peptidoglycan-binding domain-containing M23 family metallopeptidase [Pseudomonadota bacterium]